MKKRSKAVRRIYWPRCAVCKYERDHKDFRYRLMQSSYFIPGAAESANEVLQAFGAPFSNSSFYSHMQRHRATDLIKAQKKYEEHKEIKTYSVAAGLPEPVIQAVEGEVVAKSSHELALQEIVTEGRAKLKAGDMNITLTGMINASKALADIEKSTKDRRMDAVKTMFKGITGGSNEDTSKE